MFPFNSSVRNLSSTNSVNRNHSMPLLSTTVSEASLFSAYTRRRSSRPNVLVHTKSGRMNVEHKNSEFNKYWREYLCIDLFHTLIDIPGWLFLFIMLFIYCAQLMIFASLYELISEEPYKCITGVGDIWHALYFSVQTTLTIGYGDLHPDKDCFIANFLVGIQGFLNLLTDYAMLGLMYSRLSRPQSQAHSVRFSDRLTLHQVGNKRLLSFRVGNIRKHNILTPQLDAMLSLKWPIDATDGKVTNQFISIKFEAETLGPMFLGLPCVMFHAIDSESPLCGLTLEQLSRNDMELIVTFIGTNDSTSGVFQACRSYTPDEILVDHQFSAMVSRDANGQWVLDWKLFDYTEAIYSDRDQNTQCSLSESMRFGKQKRVSIDEAPSSPAANEFAANEHVILV